MVSSKGSLAPIDLQWEKHMTINKKQFSKTMSIRDFIFGMKP